ncbi:hypothetical protein HZA43_03905 [Candidatus Peregrinibacteria bacterium]|nr:hypothetical protein [Candidatus Peregrinibacteria bacterium]
MSKKTKIVLIIVAIVAATIVALQATLGIPGKWLQASILGGTQIESVIPVELQDTAKKAKPTNKNQMGGGGTIKPGTNGQMGGGGTIKPNAR